MRIIISCLIIVILFTSFNRVIHQATLPELIVQSNKIVIGQIKDVQDTSLTIRVIESVKGMFISSISIHKKQQGVYNTREIYSNKVGQVEMFFLYYNGLDKKYELYTEYGEAEYLIKDSSIYIYNRSWYLSQNRKRYSNDFILADGDSIDASLYNKNEMCAAIKDFAKNSRSIVRKLYNEPDIRSRFDRTMREKDSVSLRNKQLKIFINKSRSHQRLIDELIDDPVNELSVAYKPSSF